MSDYDSKSIPVLNDVIDDDITDEHEIIDLSNLNDSPDDDNFDLFVDNLTASIDDTENITPEIGDINDIEDQDAPLSTGTAAFGVAAFSTLKDKALTARISDEINTAFGNNEKNVFEEDNIPSVDLSEDEPEIESALIDYRVKEDIPPVEAETPLVTPLDEPEVETIEHPADTPTTPALSLEAMTEDIVKQIMPGLEEQLRLLVQQALEERLPEALVTSSSTGNGQNNDHEQ